MIAAEGLAAVGRMIAAYRRSDGAATYYKIACVTVALRDLEGHGRCLGPDGFRASAVVDRCGPAGAARVRGGARIPARFGEQSSASGHGTTFRSYRCADAGHPANTPHAADRPVLGYEALLRSPRYRGMSELKTRCVRVTYAGDCHVDLVPYVRVPLLGLYDQRFIVNRRTNDFERVSPEGFADWIRQKDRIAHGHLRTSLRLLKYLRDYKGTFEVPSVILTVLAGSRVNELFAFFERYCDLPTAFRSVVTGTDRWLQQQSGVPVVKDPSCPSVNFGHRLDEARHGHAPQLFLPGRSSLALRSSVDAGPV